MGREHNRKTRHGLQLNLESTEREGSGASRTAPASRGARAFELEFESCPQQGARARRVDVS